MLEQWLTLHFQVFLGLEVLHSWMVNDADDGHSIVLLGDGEPESASNGEQPVIRLLHCFLTWEEKHKSDKAVIMRALSLSRARSVFLWMAPNNSQSQMKAFEKWSITSRQILHSFKVADTFPCCHAQYTDCDIRASLHHINAFFYSHHVCTFLLWDILMSSCSMQFALTKLHLDSSTCKNTNK